MYDLYYWYKRRTNLLHNITSLIVRDNLLTSAYANKAAHFCDMHDISTAADKLCALNAKETNGAFKELFDRLVAKGFR